VEVSDPRGAGLEGPRGRSWRALTAPETLLAAGFFLGAWLLMLHVGFWSHAHDTSTGEYKEYGDAIRHGLVPYRDFAVEYPPGALVAFVIPSWFHDYVGTFQSLMLVCGLGIVLVSARLGRPALILTAAAPLLIGPSLMAGRFDLWPTVLAASAFAALIFDRPVLSAGLLGAAVATKLWPIVLVPIAVAWIWRRAGRNSALIAAAVAVAIPVLAYLPFVAVAPSGVWHSIHDQATRPLQVESLGAAALIEADAHIRVVNTFGSQNLAGPGVGAVTHLLTAAQLLALAAIWLLFARGPATRDRLIRHSAAAVTAFVAFDKVLSPQYVIWLVPFVALVAGRRRFAAWTVLVALLVLTQWFYPRHYPEYGLHLHRDIGAAVLARDLLLVGLTVVLAWDFTTRAERRS